MPEEVLFQVRCQDPREISGLCQQGIRWLYIHEFIDLECVCSNVSVVLVPYRVFFFFLRRLGYQLLGDGADEDATREDQQGGST